MQIKLFYTEVEVCSVQIDLYLVEMNMSSVEILKYEFGVEIYEFRTKKTISVFPTNRYGFRTKKINISVFCRNKYQFRTKNIYLCSVETDLCSVENLKACARSWPRKYWY